VLVLDLVPAAAEVPEPEPAPEPESLPELVLAPVTAVVTEPTAEVTGPEPEPVVRAMAAEVPVPAAGGAVAARACRENTSNMIRIPAATIATSTARRAMCRKIGCGMTSSRITGTDPTGS
jgi:hypothetical protein